MYINYDNIENENEYKISNIESIFEKHIELIFIDNNQQNNIDNITLIDDNQLIKDDCINNVDISIILYDIYNYVYNNYDKVVGLIPNFDKFITNSVCVSLKKSNQNLSEHECNSTYISFLFGMLYMVQQKII